MRRDELPRLLALDTATERLCVAVVIGDRIVTAEEEGGARASARLLPLVQALMAEAGLAMRDLHAIAIGRGPGAFTGLRTACSVGQGLALGLGLPVLLLDSLLLVARDALSQPGARSEAPMGTPAGDVAVLTAMDARMGEAYAAVYTARCTAPGGQAHWTTAIEPALWTPAAWQAAVEAFVGRRAGDVVLACGSAWTALEGLRVPTGVAVRPQQVNRAHALALQALQAWRDGQAVDAADALPLYLRDRVALTTAERDAQRLAAQATGPAHASGPAR